MEAIAAASMATIPRSSSILSVNKIRKNLKIRNNLSLPSHKNNYHQNPYFPIFSSSKSTPFSGAHENDSDDLYSPDSENTTLVPLFKGQVSFAHLSKDDAMGLVLSAMGRGWTTDSGMEGPSVPAGVDQSDSGLKQVSTFPWSLFTRSPRRRMRVAFTCNVCGQRTTRAINPHAYTDGTVFVQCAGCQVFHKLVDNLNLFHEVKGYVKPTHRYRDDRRYFPFEYLDMDDLPPL